MATLLRNKATGSADYSASKGVKTPAGATASKTVSTSTAKPSTPATVPGSYGIDKRTGMAIGPENDTPSGPRKANDVAPIDPTSAGAPQVPGGPEVAPPTAPTGTSMQGNTASITDPLTGQKFSRDTTVAGSAYQPNKYQQALQTAQNSGIPAPSEGGVAKMQTQGMMPNQQDTSMVDSFISQDPNVNTLMQGISQLLNPQHQSSTLLQDYKKLYKQSGLDEINEELIDADTVINGTEDDIRREITTAGGFGTESQVQAMSLARNKGLLTRYNQLVQMKTDATNQLNTLSQLNQQDKQMAQTRLNTQINAMFSMANFQQQAQNNTREAFNSMVNRVGYAGAYQAYSQNPQQLAYIEKIAGLGTGGLQNLASQPDYEMESKKLGLQLQKSQLYTQGLQQQKLVQDMQPKTSPAAGPLQLATAQGNIQQVDGLLKMNQGGAVGATDGARRTPFKDVTSGARSNFIANVQQVANQLTLSNLQNAKANGATFGALSEGELSLLSNSATKLNTWAVKDSGGNVTGYATTKQEFNNELDKINNYAKLDYVLKGGSPDSIGVVEHPDGTLWTMNSNGMMTEIR